MTLSIISAISENGVIGKDNTLPWHFSSDLKYFKQITAGKTIIMGRGTFESEGIPKPLPNRRNIVVTSNQQYITPYDVEIVHSLEQALDISKDDGEVFVIGGSKLYEQALKKVDKLYITLINKQYDGDTYFPKFNWQDFIIVDQRPIEENGVTLSFIEAIRGS